MLLGGLWHGAGWTFVAWGALHGIALIINHGWRYACSHLSYSCQAVFSGRGWAWLSWLLTFLLVVFGWAFFRATDLASAIAIIKGMTGINGLVFPESWEGRLGFLGGWLSSHGIAFANAGTFRFEALPWIAALLGLALLAPNALELTQRFRPALNHATIQVRPLPVWLCWVPNWRWGLGIGLVAAVSIGSLTKVSEFLYFQF